MWKQPKSCQLVESFVCDDEDFVGDPGGDGHLALDFLLSLPPSLYLFLSLSISSSCLSVWKIKVWRLPRRSSNMWHAFRTPRCATLHRDREHHQGRSAAEDLPSGPGGPHRWDLSLPPESIHSRFVFIIHYHNENFSPSDVVIKWIQS